MLLARDSRQFLAVGVKEPAAGSSIIVNVLRLHTLTADLHLSLQRCVHVHVCKLKKTALEPLDLVQLMLCGSSGFSRW